MHKSGSWFSYGDQRIGQGHEAARKYLNDNPEFYEEIDRQLREIYYSDSGADSAGDGDRRFQDDGGKGTSDVRGTGSSGRSRELSSLAGGFRGTAVPLSVAQNPVRRSALEEARDAIARRR